MLLKVYHPCLLESQFLLFVILEVKLRSRDRRKNFFLFPFSQEGAIIITGMSYNGRDEHGNRRWDACTNIKVYQLETGEHFSDFIQSFNFNTNQWMLKWVFLVVNFCKTYLTKYIGILSCSKL